MSFKNNLTEILINLADKTSLGKYITTEYGRDDQGFGGLITSKSVVSGPLADAYDAILKEAIIMAQKAAEEMVESYVAKKCNDMGLSTYLMESPKLQNEILSLFPTEIEI